jgi:hypothetical protein
MESPTHTPFAMPTVTANGVPDTISKHTGVNSRKRFALWRKAVAKAQRRFPFAQQPKAAPPCA